MKLSKFLSPSYKLPAAITILLIFFLVETICYAYFYISLAYSQQIMTLLILVQVLLPLVLLIIYTPYLNKTSKKIVLILISVYYFLELLAALYRVSREVSFNWFWLWYNKSEVFETIFGVFDNLGIYLAGLILIFILIYLSLAHVVNRVTKLHGKKKYQALVILPLLITILFFGLYPQNPEIIKTIRETFTSNSEVIKIYNQYYKDALQTINSHNKQVLLENDSINPEENIFFIHLESLNSSLVNEEVTPAIWRVAQEHGVLLSNFQTNNVQTIRSEESILCPVLPSLDKTLHQQGVADKLLCLPQILKDLGYKTLFFKGHDLGFSGTGNFMLNIGFNEVHNGDIMQSGDPLLEWGFREDVFYQRVFEYLEKYKDEKLFVYIAVSTTNHLPFGIDTKNYQDLIHLLPRPNAANQDVIDYIENTTFLQDYFFGNLFDNLYPPYQENSHMFVFGDQAWPMGQHDNYYNEVGAWQENFLSALVIAPATKSRQDSSTEFINKTYASQNDLMPTVLNLLNINGLKTLGKNLLTRKIDNRCIVSAQPYSRRYLSLINYPIKYIYNILDNRLVIYNLELDQKEKQPLLEARADNSSFLKQCLKELTDN